MTLETDPDGSVSGIMSTMLAKGAKNLKLATQMQHPEMVVLLTPLAS